ncbi:MAG: type II toxin-antitoxin system PemK/MazF family toxin [bacterium]|nr:type II toxin-antitoxin system PemK/MazF family toxin [bacterium]MDP2703977.1 type II toxin-antitoxin system PemK/MazF family toxin [bacterium]
MQKGTIVLVRFPFTDLGADKLRPAVVLRPENVYGDVCVAFITSSAFHGDDAVLISEGEPDFKMTGLKMGSAIRVGKIATLHARLIAGEIGKLPGARLRELDDILRKVFGL